LFGGVQRFYKHDSREIRGPMKFSAYLPRRRRAGKVPVLYYLAGPRAPRRLFRSNRMRSRPRRNWG